MLVDEHQRLREVDGLMQLLRYYAEQNLVTPDAWLDRLMQIEGAEPRELVRWHGELIAFGWIEQNTGQIPACYRITVPGLRANRQIQEPAEVELPEAA